MIILSREQVIRLHQMLIDQTGGLGGVREMNLLDSALQSPMQTFDGQELYPTVQRKAACLCFGLVNNHPFLDGNKRIGILAMLTVLSLNDLSVNCSDKELVELGQDIASGKVNINVIEEWILSHQLMD